MPKTPYTALSFHQKMYAVHRKSFQKDRLFTASLPNFMMCAIFQTNTDLVKIYEHIAIFTQETLQLFFIW